MKFPNLSWATHQGGLTHYRVAARVGMSESKFSRCLTGRSEFSQEERSRLAAVLQYPQAWLFQEIVPPERLQRSDDYAGLMHV
jgi:helix-turn-helix protein